MAARYLPYWTDPKTDWNPGDGIMAGDLNRMEKNSAALYFGLRRQVSMGSTLPNVNLVNNSIPNETEMALVLGMGALFVPQEAEIIVSGNTLYRVNTQDGLTAFIGVYVLNAVSYSNNIGSLLTPSGTDYVYAGVNNLKNNAIYYQEFMTDVIPIPKINLGLDHNETVLILCGYSFKMKSGTSLNAPILHMNATFTAVPMDPNSLTFT